MVNLGMGFSESDVFPAVTSPPMLDELDSTWPVGLAKYWTTEWLSHFSTAIPSASKE
jgi:hypothetical protein